MTAAHLQLLGPARVHLDSRTQPFSRDKRYQLLAYLACRQEWVTREQLAFLFWPDVPNQAARKNLRHLLQRVKALAWNPTLETEAHQLRWRVATDVRVFQQACAEQRWQDALAHYAGPLLQGLDSGDASEFARWLEGERGQLHDLWRTATEQQAEVLQQQQRHLEAMALLGSLLEHDDLDEEVVAAFMTAAARAGRREQALRAYQQFCDTLEQELALAPTSALERLAEAIRNEPAPSATPADAVGQAAAATAEPSETRAETETAISAPEAAAARPRPKPLPSTATPFVGRDLLLAEIANALAQPNCRLLTLVGSGGVGKSRTALQAALEHEAAFPDGVAYVPLVPITDPAGVPAAAAEAVGLTPRAGEDPLRQLVAHLETSRLLLLFDNFEHLLPAAAVVHELLAHCPQLVVIATSRERLDLSEEQVLPVEGFPVPPATDLVPEEAAAFDALQLFTLQARRVRPDFTVEADELPHLLEICRLVEGFPLGIELAAVWVRLLSPADIAEEIAASMDFLSSERCDLADRHQSIRAAFEHSWRLLRPIEQQALRRLSVFRGGFGREGARKVTGIALPVLAGLVDKSLVTVGDDGRYYRHAQLYSYMLEKLAEHPREQRTARERHAAYYLRALARWGEALAGAQQSEALERLEQEEANIRVAWSWACAHADAQWLRQLIGPLTRYYELQARFRDGLNALEEAAAALDADLPGHPAPLGAIRIEQAWLHQNLGEYPQAAACCREGLQLLRNEDEPRLETAGLRIQAVIAYAGGNLEEAKTYLHEALAIARKHHDHGFEATCLGNLAITEEMLGDYDAAEELHRTALLLDRRREDEAALTHALSNFGNFQRERGRLDEAKALLEESLALSRANGFGHMLPYILAGLGEACFQSGAYDAAESYYQNATPLAQQSDDPAIIAELLVYRGRLASARFELARAQQYLHQALALTWDRQELPRVLLAIVAWGEWFACCGEHPRAAKLLELASCHPATRSLNRDLARRLLAGLEADAVGADQSEAEMDDGREAAGDGHEPCSEASLGLDSTVAYLLYQLPPLAA